MQLKAKLGILPNFLYDLVFMFVLDEGGKGEEKTKSGSLLLVCS